MSSNVIPITSSATKYPQVMVMRARELYLLGNSCMRVVTLLTVEAKKQRWKILPPENTVARWARQDGWKLLRAKARLAEEDVQLLRVQRRIARELNSLGAQVSKTRRLLDDFLKAPKIRLNEDGERVIVRHKNGRPVMIDRTPETDYIEMDDLLRLRMQHAGVTKDYLRQLSEMVGGFAPKADLDTLTNEEDDQDA